MKRANYSADSESEDLGNDDQWRSGYLLEKFDMLDTVVEIPDMNIKVPEDEPIEIPDMNVVVPEDHYIDVVGAVKVVEQKHEDCDEYISVSIQNNYLNTEINKPPTCMPPGSKCAVVTERDSADYGKRFWWYNGPLSKKDVKDAGLETFCMDGEAYAEKARETRRQDYAWCKQNNVDKKFHRPPVGAPDNVKFKCARNPLVFGQEAGEFFWIAMDKHGVQYFQWDDICKDHLTSDFTPF